MREPEIRKRHYLEFRYMTNLSRTSFTMGFLALTLIFHSSVWGQEKAKPPAQALLDLNQAAEKIIKDPGSEYRKGGNPDFPHPSDVQAQWDASMAAHGNDLSAEQRKLFPACAAHLNSAITDMEI